MTAVLFVPVHETLEESMDLHDLERFVDRFWPITPTKAMTADRVVAVFNAAHWTCARPVAAWRLRFAFPIDGTRYAVAANDERKRTGLALGGPIPVLDAYHVALKQLRRPRVIDLPVQPFPIERQLP
ncbi:MAG: hypothetical protein JWM34_3303 [Ilumatobacteraceae bacterium]|nr:hypothetical protein [Ilumatobacteraceae bacterium]